MFTQRTSLVCSCRSAAPRRLASMYSTVRLRSLATAAKSVSRPKKEGDISSVFVSLSGGQAPQLSQRFADLKNHLIRGDESKLSASWQRLLSQLVTQNEQVRTAGPAIVPSIHYDELAQSPTKFAKQVKDRGVAVIRGVVPEDEARSYKSEVEEYVRQNPWTKAFPSHDPQVFELYWSAPQIKARSNPRFMEMQRYLMNLWHSNDPSALISMQRPLMYADRLRIRQPGDSGFALGPHVDGGSLERWEPDGYGKGDVYKNIWEGDWENYDPWEASCRLPVVSDLYEGAGACSMFRMFQGWLSMSHTKPGEGTLMVNPLLRLSTTYFLLRPFFEPIKKPEMLVAGQYDESFLDASNWRLKSQEEMTPELQGANPGHAQELNGVLHPHLDLKNTMVHVPEIRPGDYVAWHCDTIHAVDKLHAGKTDSSVMYIPVCPTTLSNAVYVARQRDTFQEGLPGPDFPGGKGESEHSGRPTETYMQRHVTKDGLQAMGLERLNTAEWQETLGARTVIKLANAALGFD